MPSRPDETRMGGVNETFAIGVATWKLEAREAFQKFADRYGEARIDHETGRPFIWYDRNKYLIPAIKLTLLMVPDNYIYKTNKLIKRIDDQIFKITQTDENPNVQVLKDYISVRFINTTGTLLDQMGFDGIFDFDDEHGNHIIAGLDVTVNAKKVSGEKYHNPYSAIFDLNIEYDEEPERYEQEIRNVARTIVNIAASQHLRFAA